jgi:ubiquinol-cytochrome c reductase cytochrome b subunit
METYTRNSLTSIIFNNVINYPTPQNFNYYFGYGSLSLLCLGIQIVSGILLAMHYIPSSDLAFLSVEHIMRDVQLGWFIRYAHANGASMFFICLYIHLLRGIYYGSFIYPRTYTWFTGFIIFILTIATAFLGYVLPWGQMSFWAATVITNLFSVIPFVGNSIVEWLWGGFSVASPTLNRFFSLHFLLPFIITGLVAIHISFVHKTSSNNPLAITNNNFISFYPYFFIKDLLGVEVFLIFFSFFLFNAPNLLGHPDNYVYADSLSTPAHIVPEWYFLPLYAILRSIPSKKMGVAYMGLTLAVLMNFPFRNKSLTKGSSFCLNSKVSFWFFVFNGIFLGWLGQKAMEYPYLDIGVFSSLTFVWSVWYQK